MKNNRTNAIFLAVMFTIAGYCLHGFILEIAPKNTAGSMIRETRKSYAAMSARYYMIDSAGNEIPGMGKQAMRYFDSCDATKEVAIQKELDSLRCECFRLNSYIDQIYKKLF